MSDISAPETAEFVEAVTAAEPQESHEEQKTFPAEHVEKLRRENAKYRTDAREAQRRLAELEQGKKSVEERLADLEARRAAAEAKALRSDIAAEFGVSAEDRDLFMTGDDPELLRRQAEVLGQRAERRARGNYAPYEGRNPSPTVSDEMSAVRALFGDQ